MIDTWINIEEKGEIKGTLYTIIMNIGILVLIFVTAYQSNWIFHSFEIIIESLFWKKKN